MRHRISYPLAATMAAPVGAATRQSICWLALAALSLTLAACGGSDEPPAAAGVVAPVITGQPGSLRVTAPTEARFSVNVTGTAPTYQWQRCTDTLPTCATWADVAGASTDTLATGPTSTTMNGQRLRVLVSNAAGRETSNEATLSVDPTPVPPSIDSAPTSTTVAVGTAARFTVAVSGVPAPTLQWESSSDGATWSALGATDLSYATAPTTLGDSGWRFRVVASSSAGSVTSAAATLTVTQATVPPFFTRAPQSLRVAYGQDATFTATATGVPPPTIRWQTSVDAGSTWSFIGGPSSTTYTVYAASAAYDGNRYRAVADSTSGTEFSAAAELSVDLPPPCPGLALDNAPVTANGRFCPNTVPRLDIQSASRAIVTWFEYFSNGIDFESVQVVFNPTTSEVDSVSYNLHDPQRQVTKLCSSLSFAPPPCTNLSISAVTASARFSGLVLGTDSTAITLTGELVFTP